MTQAKEFAFVVKKSGFNGVMNLHSYLFAQIFAYESHFEEALNILKQCVENLDEKTMKAVFDNFIMLEIIHKV
jgi:ribonucleotide reductase alpha subunit